jgi:hypothetical protein
MDINGDQIRALVAQPREALTIELKAWIDPTTPVAQAKIVRAALALRNRNGGFVVIGFDDKTFLPAPHAPTDVRATFRPDDIQQLISRYASHPFEVAVEFAERDGKEYPVVAVPSGVTVPVAIKGDLIDGNKALLKFGEVPFRTLHANGTFSTAAARPEDWKDIVEICFDNREADVGRFVRRHLGGLTAETLADLGVALRLGSSSPSDSLRDSAVSLLDAGHARYQKLLAERGVAAGPEEAVQTWGTWEVAFVVDPANPEGVATRDFYNELVGSNPEYTKWPIWGNTLALSDAYGRASVREGAWESLFISIRSHLPWDVLDFSRLDPKGSCYELRASDDDAFARTRGAQVHAILDPALVIQRVTEALLVGLHYAKTFDTDAKSNLGFAFRWKGLKGRTIGSWSGQVLVIPGLYKTAEDEDTSFVAMPADTAESAVAPFVQKAVRSLFARFDGYAMGLNVIEQLVRMVVERRVA